MNNINRTVVKAQAREIIRGKVFFIFLVSLIVMLLTNAALGGSYSFNGSYDELFKENNGSDFDYYENFEGENPIEDFEGSNPFDDFQFESYDEASDVSDMSKSKQLPVQTLVLGGFGVGVSGLVGIVFCPMIVTLSGIYLSLVRRKPDENFRLGKEISGLFANTFNETYAKKLGLVLLQRVLTFALCLLFVVPGIIFTYSAYFANEILSDNPNMSPTEAIKTSRKMVMGNRTELFVLDLSFALWFLFIIITIGFGSIYVTPYVMTTKALYYENFRIRAMQQGRITADDFLSARERAEKYQAAHGNYYSNENQNNYGTYTVPPQNASGYYYAPPSENTKATSTVSDFENSAQAYTAEPSENNPPPCGGFTDKAEEAQQNAGENENNQ